MNDRNWLRLLISTLERARELLPGPGPIKQADFDKMVSLEQKRFLLGEDIDQILEMNRDRGS